VPEVLLGGNHAEIARWRRRAAFLKTRRNRPDLLERAALTEEERAWLEEIDK
jgi:tRNA (guanine37-N1)-methyltransferase